MAWPGSGRLSGFVRSTAVGRAGCYQVDFFAIWSAHGEAGASLASWHAPCFQYLYSPHSPGDAACTTVANGVAINATVASTLAIRMLDSVCIFRQAVPYDSG